MHFFKRTITCLMIVFSFACSAQQVKVIQYTDLDALLAKSGDSVLVVNFWATWCLPCVEELPYFEKAQVKYAKDKVKVLLISLDYVSVLEKKVKPFLARTRMKAASVYLLNETNPNSWMGKVDQDWSGALPFTLITRPKVARKTYEKSFTEEELEKEIQSFIQ